jgi:hypothetical protein
VTRNSANGPDRVDLIFSVFPLSLTNETGPLLGLASPRISCYRKRLP